MAGKSSAASTIGRDVFLDCLKGLAILVVILGHEFQGMTPDFDHFWPFRIVYSFHMPLFMFVAGMVTALSFSAYLGDLPPAWRELVARLGDDIRSKTLRLLVPFFIFAVVTHVWRGGSWPELPAWLWGVVQQPDIGLWFLPTLWICHVMLLVVAAVLTGARWLLHRGFKKCDTREIRLSLMLCFSILLWLVMLRFFHSHALFLARLHFPYYVAGVIFYAMRPALPLVLRVLPYLVFAALIPFWFRTGLTPLVKDVAGLRLWFMADMIFRFAVAFGGIFIMMDLARLCARHLHPMLREGLAFIGTRTLDIYALHFYFLGFFPPFLAPLALSLGASALLRLNAITSGLCFGQWRGPTRRRTVVGPA